MRHELAYLCFGLSSFFRVLGKMVRSGPTILVDSLSMKGWFIIDCYLIEQVPLGKGITGFLKGFEWHTYPMPDDWVKQVNKYKEKR